MQLSRLVTVFRWKILKFQKKREFIYGKEKRKSEIPKFYEELEVCSKVVSINTYLKKYMRYLCCIRVEGL